MYILTHSFQGVFPGSMGNLKFDTICYDFLFYLRIFFSVRSNSLYGFCFMLKLKCHCFTMSYVSSIKIRLTPCTNQLLVALCKCVCSTMLRMSVAGR